MKPALNCFKLIPYIRNLKEQEIKFPLQHKIVNLKTPVPVPTNPISLGLFRRATKEANKFPLPQFRSKIRYNVRELFELYRYCDDASKVLQLQADAIKDIRFLKSWQHVDKENLTKLFKKPNTDLGNIGKNTKKEVEEDNEVNEPEIKEPEVEEPEIKEPGVKNPEIKEPGVEKPVTK